MQAENIPLLSVVCATYNQAKYLRDTINGMISQKTNFKFEILIHDDASTDNAHEIILDYQLRYPDLITPILQKENQYSKGVHIWHDILFKKAKGKYIALCDGDDYWTDPLKLQKQVDFLESNPDYVMCFHPAMILERDGTLRDDYITKVPENFETIEALASKGNYVHTPTVVFRNIIDTFPEEVTQSPVGDYFLYMLLAQYGKLGKLDDVMAVYRHQIGIWSTLDGKSNRLKWLFMLMLISAAFVSNVEIKHLIDLKIKRNIINFFPRASAEDLTYLRSNPKTSKLLDELLLEVIVHYKKNQVSNTSSKALLKILFNRFMSKIGLN